VSDPDEGYLFTSAQHEDGVEAFGTGKVPRPGITGRPPPRSGPRPTC